MPDAVDQNVLRARRRIARAEEEYSETLEEALEAGKSYADLARLLGVSRQAVREYVEKRRQA